MTKGQESIVKLLSIIEDFRETSTMYVDRARSLCFSEDEVKELIKLLNDIHLNFANTTIPIAFIFRGFDADDNAFSEGLKKAINAKLLLESQIMENAKKAIQAGKN